MMVANGYIWIISPNDQPFFKKNVGQCYADIGGPVVTHLTWQLAILGEYRWCS